MAVRGAGAPSGPLVGRTEEQEAIAAALQEAVAGQPSVVWVEGEPGFGKTSLVRDAMGRAPTGMQVRQMNADEPASEIPFELAGRLGSSTTDTSFAAGTRATRSVGARPRRGPGGHRRGGPALGRPGVLESACCVRPSDWTRTGSGRRHDQARCARGLGASAGRPRAVPSYRPERPQCRRTSPRGAGRGSGADPNPGGATAPPYRGSSPLCPHAADRAQPGRTPGHEATSPHPPRSPPRHRRVVRGPGAGPTTRRRHGGGQPAGGNRARSGGWWASTRPSNLSRSCSERGSSTGNPTSPEPRSSSPTLCTARRSTGTLRPVPAETCTGPPPPSPAR